MRSNKLLLGRIGENIASDFLKKNGYQIIEQNFKKKHGDIDIITKKEEVLIFVEVKTRQINKDYPIEESFNKKKISRLVRAAEYYQYIKNLPDTSMRIDLICINFDNTYDKYEIKHYLNISR